MKHRERMSRIAMTLMPPEWSAAFPEFMKRVDASKADPKHMRILRRCWSTANATLAAQLVNGAGRDADQTLRYFLSDVCNRLWSLGPWDSLPSSFNVTSDFMRYLPKINSYELLQEVDHEFSLTEFLDFVTDPRENLSSPTLHALAPEGTILHFTNIAPLNETIVGDSRTQRFAFSSCSLVRHETELSLCIVAGQPIEAASRGLALFADGGNVVIPEGRARLKEIAIREQRRPVPLRDQDKWWKTLLLLRVDLKQGAAEVRYVLRDCGDVFDIITDDASTFFDSKGQPISSDWEEILRKNVARLDEFGPLFELAHYCIFLPKYFSVRRSHTTAKAIRTEFGQLLHSTKFRRRVSAARSNARVAHRTLLEMQPTSTLTPNEMFAPASLRIERTGYWKTLRPNQEGIDREGKPVYGKTWVTKELTWIENDVPSENLRIESGPELEGPDPGSIYVFRNAAHPEDVFKIGLTRRDVETRANELGASTGAPDKFLVVQRWHVRDCLKVEAAIHEYLAQYRLTGRREFFKVPYEVARVAIERVLAEERGQDFEG